MESMSRECGEQSRKEEAQRRTQLDLRSLLHTPRCGMPCGDESRRGMERTQERAAPLRRASVNALGTELQVVQTRR